MVRALALAAAILPYAQADLLIASALSVIEWTPQLIAKEDFYDGTVNIINGGVPNLFSNSSVDIAANAETQALRNYANHTNLRIIYTESEVAYRIVADKRKIATAKDLIGKKIGAVPSTSSGYFVDKFMSSLGANKTQYQIVSGDICLSEPCGNKTLVSKFKSGEIDAVGIWEPTVELAARAIGLNNSAFFQDFEVYREIYNLHSTVEKLRNPRKRREIVSFIRSLEKAMKLFRDDPDRVVGRAAKAVNMTEELMHAVWPVHKWPGTIPDDLLDVLVEEDKYVASLSNRTAMTRRRLRPIIDYSILDEVRGEDDDDDDEDDWWKTA